jgi:hypothetical protein
MSVTVTNEADAFASEDERVKPGVRRTVAEESLQLQVWDYPTGNDR